MYMANTCIFRIVINEFSHWKKLSPIILLIFDKSPIILLFGQVLSLMMEDNGELLLYSQKITK